MPLSYGMCTTGGIQNVDVSPRVSPQTVGIQASGVPPNTARRLFLYRPHSNPENQNVRPLFRTARTLMLAVFMTVLACHPVCAQFGRSDSSESFNPVARGLKDLWIQAKAPFSISSNDAPWVLGGAATLGGFLLADQAVYDAVDPPSLDRTGTGRISQTVTKFGATYGLAFLAGFTGYGFIAKDDKALETSYLAAEAIATSGFWTQVFKAVSGRERPAARTRSGGKWTGPFGSSFAKHFSDFDSFTSGHTSTAFSIATVFAEQYSETPAVPIICYSAASLVGVSRLVVNRHWASDVFAGAIIGYLCAREVVANNPSESSRSRAHSEARLTILPRQHDYGFVLIVQF